MDSLRILVLEDDKILTKWYKTFFSKVAFPKCDVVYLDNLEIYKDEYENTYFDLALIDYFISDNNSIDLIHNLKFNFPKCYLAVISGLNNPDTIRQLYNTGVDVFLKKPLKDNEIQAILNLVFDQLSITYTNIYSEKVNLISQKVHTNENSSLNAPEIIYISKPMDKLITKMLKVANSNSTVLIRGESGTGKELVARNLHAKSSRCNKPFVELNIAALPETLIESELFGYKKGAFTGADSDREGRFAAAEGGTIFIDEIGDIPTSVQVKLLRLLQFKEYQRIGDNKTYQSDVRILAATSRDLEQLIVERNFREDLFYRLSVITLTIPPLRKRKADIQPLIDYFLNVKAKRHNKTNLHIENKTYSRLQNYNFPGNIRELENIIEHGIIMSRSGSIGLEDLPDPLVQELNSYNDEVHIDKQELEYEITGDYDVDMAGFEKYILTSSLIKFSGNQTAAANSLGITERRLRYRLQTLNIQNSYRK